MSDPLVLIGVGLAVFVLAGIAQSVSGIGAALVSVPLVTLVVDPVSGVVAATAVSLFMAGQASVRERDHVDRPAAGRLLLAGTLGMPVGLWLLVALPETALTVLMAVTVAVALVLVGGRVRVGGGAVTTWFCGALSGTLLTSTAMNGPPLVLALHNLGLPPRKFRATVQVVFAGHDLLAVAGFLVVGQFSPAAFWLTVGGVVGSTAGWALGDRLFHRLSLELFRRVLLAGLSASALTLLASALL